MYLIPREIVNQDIRIKTFSFKKCSITTLILWGEDPCGQSYKHFTLVNYYSRVVPDWKIPHFTTLES